MNKAVFILCAIVLFAACKNGNVQPERRIVAEVGKASLYYDELPEIVLNVENDTDSATLIQNYINKWAKRQLILQKAEDNMSPAMKKEIDSQLEETKENLVIYQYQQRMILEKLDTVITDAEIENFYVSNEKSFLLNSNIVKALFIKLPLETPDLYKIKTLARSNDQKDLQQLEGLCYEFAEKIDDFNEEWIPMDKIIVELQINIDDQENFLRRNTFLETNDSTSIYLVSFRDYRLRSSLAPFDYVKNDIKRIIWNTRRFEFIQSLENGIYNDALKDNRFKIY